MMLYARSAVGFLSSSKKAWFKFQPATFLTFMALPHFSLAGTCFSSVPKDPTEVVHTPLAVPQTSWLQEVPKGMDASSNKAGARSLVYLSQKERLDREELLNKYDLEKITDGMIITPKEIQPFGSIKTAAIEKAKQEYLNRPEIKAIKLNILNQYIRKYEAELKRELRFRDFSRDDLYLVYVPSRAIKRVIDATKGGSHALDLNYYLKRSLWFLQSITDKKLQADKIQQVLVYLVSGGQHCTSGITDAAKLAERALYNGSLDLGQKEPQDFTESMLFRLDLLREFTFEEAKAFVDDSETGVTNRVLREDLSERLGILPDATEKQFPGYFYGNGKLKRSELAALVEMRFFYGKVSDPDCVEIVPERSLPNQERCRSHVGYSPIEVAKEIIWSIYMIRRNGSLDLRSGPFGIDALLFSRAGAKKYADLFARDHILRWYTREILGLDGREDLEQTSIMLKALSEDELKELFINAKYFTIRHRNIELLNDEAIRELMLALNVARLI